MPESVKKLFTYNPEKAKKLQVEAGYPNECSVMVRVIANNPTHADLLPLAAASPGC